VAGLAAVELLARTLDTDLARVGRSLYLAGSVLGLASTTYDRFDNLAVYITRLRPDGQTERLWTVDLDAEHCEAFWTKTRHTLEGLFLTAEAAPPRAPDRAIRTSAQPQRRRSHQRNLRPRLAGPLPETRTRSPAPSACQPARRPQNWQFCTAQLRRTRQKHTAQNRQGDLALCFYMKSLRSNCRCDENTLAESWKFMHSCAYMRPGATPSIRLWKCERHTPGQPVLHATARLCPAKMLSCRAAPCACVPKFITDGSLA
jgi:hypothetical protein